MGASYLPGANAQAPIAASPKTIECLFDGQHTNQLRYARL